jgi:hypothetical protein
MMRVEIPPPLPSNVRRRSRSPSTTSSTSASSRSRSPPADRPLTQRGPAAPLDGWREPTLHQPPAINAFNPHSAAPANAGALGWAPAATGATPFAVTLLREHLQDLGARPETMNQLADLSRHSERDDRLTHDLIQTLRLPQHSGTENTVYLLRCLAAPSFRPVLASLQAVHPTQRAQLAEVFQRIPPPELEELFDVLQHDPEPLRLETLACVAENPHLGQLIGQGWGEGTTAPQRSFLDSLVRAFPELMRSSFIEDAAQQPRPTDVRGRFASLYQLAGHWGLELEILQELTQEMASAAEPQAPSAHPAVEAHLAQLPDDLQGMLSIRFEALSADDRRDLFEQLERDPPQVREDSLRRISAPGGLHLAQLLAQGWGEGSTSADRVLLHDLIAGIPAENRSDFVGACGLTDLAPEAGMRFTVLLDVGRRHGLYSRRAELLSSSIARLHPPAVSARGLGWSAAAEGPSSLLAVEQQRMNLESLGANPETVATLTSLGQRSSLELSRTDTLLRLLNLRAFPGTPSTEYLLGCLTSPAHRPLLEQIAEHDSITQLTFASVMQQLSTEDIAGLFAQLQHDPARDLDEAVRLMTSAGGEELALLLARGWGEELSTPQRAFLSEVVVQVPGAQRAAFIEECGRLTPDAPETRAEQLIRVSEWHGGLPGAQTLRRTAAALFGPLAETGGVSRDASMQAQRLSRGLELSRFPGTPATEMITRALGLPRFQMVFDVIDGLSPSIQRTIGQRLQTLSPQEVAGLLAQLRLDDPLTLESALQLMAAEGGEVTTRLLANGWSGGLDSEQGGLFNRLAVGLTPEERASFLELALQQEVPPFA